MKTNRLLLSFCAAALAFPYAASAQEEKKYQIKLDRPDKAGDKSHEEMTATVEKSQRITQGDKVLKEESSDTRVSLSGTLEVLEVSDKSKIKKIRFTVGKFTCKEEEETEEQPLKEGTVIIGTAVGGKAKNKFEVDGKAVEEKTGDLLHELLTMSGADKKQIEDDVIFGSKEPRAAGSEWKVDPKVFVDAMPDDMPFKIDEKGINGKVKFPVVKTVDGIESCHILMSVEMKPSSIEAMPPNFKIDTASFKVAGEKLAPVDQKLMIPWEKMDQKTEVSGGAGPIKLKIYQRTVRERTSKALK